MDKNEFSRRQFLKRGLTLTGSSVALGAVESASAATSNSIVTENKLTGTAQSQWDLSGEGQYSVFGLGNGQTPLAGVTNYIEGFADNMSVNHGQTINFKINTNCKNYRIDIYRLGYYAGLGARLSNSGSAASTGRYETPGPRGETLLAARADREFGTVAKRDVLLGAAGGHLEMD